MALDYERDRRRAAQRRGRNAGAEDTRDTVNNALTFQIVFCILLIASVHLIKSVNEPLYGTVREQAGIVLNEGQSLDLDGYRQALDERLAGVRQFFSNLFSSSDKESEEGVPDGSGGWQPVSGKASEAMAPPDYALFSPVFVSAALIQPVDGWVSSPFGYRYHPITDALDFHRGTDIAVAQGTAIRVVLPGVVTEVGESDVYGNYIVVQHAEGLLTAYSHCNEIVAAEGVMLRQGDRIATVGTTGVSTGPHLHFEVIVNGYYTDPSWVLPSGGGEAANGTRSI